MVILDAAPSPDLMPENIQEIGPSVKNINTFYGEKDISNSQASENIGSKKSALKSKFVDEELKKQTENNFKTSYDKTNEVILSDLKGSSDFEKSRKFNVDVALRKPVDVQIQEYEQKTNATVNHKLLKLCIFIRFVDFYLMKCAFIPAGIFHLFFL